MSDLMRERALRPIYSYLDTFSYSRALKHTYAKPQNQWPITIALRAHCLQRMGKKLDACREIRILLSFLTLDKDEKEKGRERNKNNSVSISFRSADTVT